VQNERRLEMFAHLKRLPRSLARNYCLNSNTIRYLVEYRCIVTLLKNAKLQFSSLIDLGAGSGEMSARLIEQGFALQCTAVEPDDRNFRLLEQRYAELPGSYCLHSSLEQTRVERESFDAVLSTQVLEHILDDESAVSAIYSLLKPSGVAIISVPHPPEIFPNPGHVRPGYTRDELTSLFERHNFRLISYDYFLTLSTLRRVVASQELGVLGQFIPVRWADRERKLSRPEKAKQQPYGLACLFRRN
jgi:SAM-dependent methyltransferase